MKITKLSPKRLLLEFATRKEMTLSNFRISEFFEGKEGIKGQYFTADQFIDKYSDEKGDLDYFSYWEGFNYPKADLMIFYRTFEDLSTREINIINASKQIDDNGYIISCEEGDAMTIKHETAHAIFFENEEYKVKATEVINTLDSSIIEKYKNHLKEMGYIEEVLIDEMNAYLVAFDQEEWDECFPSIKEEDIYSHRANLNGLFDNYNK